MPQTNAKVAALFQEMADALEIQGGDRFRVNAFIRAARAIEAQTQDLADIGPDLKKLTTIDGIGKGTAQRIIQFLQTGKMDDHDKLMDQIPPGLMALRGISGLGPKTISLLWKQAGIQSLDDLKAKLQTDELAQLAGLGKKKLDNIRKSIEFAAQAGGRVRLGQALPMALWFVSQLRDVDGVIEVTHAGSLRRGKETIGDLDLLVAAKDKDRPAISKAFVSMEPVDQILVRGSTKTSIRTSDGMQVDLRIVKPDSFGAALMYFTGSKEHNVAMRERAIRQGCSLNEYALTKDGKPLAGRSEEEVFAALGLAWIPPALRENHGELALAEKDNLPQLITIDDIKAELHAHTNASDGRWSIRELAIAAAERGFHTVAVTDHSKGQAQANGLDAKRLEKHIEDIHEVAAELKDTITVLAGTEVDILANGKLDYSDSLLEGLDIVVASPHAALSQDPAKATARLLKAIDNPYVTILGHPTGRLINRRQGLSPDMTKIIEASAQRGIALELNANHHRLDLRDTHVRAAIDAGVMLSINTDAHGPADLDELIYGILTARRAGAQKEHVINCMSKAGLAHWLARQRCLVEPLARQRCRVRRQPSEDSNRSGSQMRDLTRLAELIKKRNLLDREITALIGRPAVIGHIGEYIASRVFQIALEESASQKGIDGRFSDGPLKSRTVNVKWYAKSEYSLDINPDALPDYYLVLTGPKSGAMNSRGRPRPLTIENVYLFDAQALVDELKRGGAKIGTATSVRQYLWAKAEIYPAQSNDAIGLSEEQHQALALFCSRAVG